MPKGPIRPPEGTEIPFLPEYFVGFKVKNNLTGKPLR
ncbi:MAG: hypothetical protein US89_C0015G0022 [Candidatus Peregrinibacteria bacterium GW2011_GWF2_38_29]|nr:MAG: hypothetical protein US89_C0015G0022 [Candidatus Peregrinibacteria bacterium GW2011_GWF2_38_29]